MSKLPYVNQSIKDVHDSASPESTRVSMYGWDSDSSAKTRVSVNSDGSINVVPNGSVVDSNNSSSTPLAGDAVFTGTATEVLHFAAITILVESDVASADNGMVVQFSEDGSDWHDGESYTISAGSTKFFTPPVQSRYFRIVYTNGSSAQSEFHLHTILKKTPIKWSSHNIEDPIKDGDDAELVKAVITGKKANGDFDNASLTNGGNFKVSIEEYDAGISSGLPTRGAFQVNDIEETGTTTYIGKEASDGTWWLVKIDESGSPTTIQHASITTDAAQTTYTLAWTNRASLSYTDYSGAF